MLSGIVSYSGACPQSTKGDHGSLNKVGVHARQIANVVVCVCLCRCEKEIGKYWMKSAKIARRLS